jgi:hypothetical protein
MKATGAVLSLLLSATTTCGFIPSWGHHHHYGVLQPKLRQGSVVVVKGGNSNAAEAMSDFFLANNDWHPVFRSLAADSSVPAMSFLRDVDEISISSIGGVGSIWEDATTTITPSVGPWKQLQAIPTGEHERRVVAGFLDAMQQALLEIPCLSEEDDEFDAQFIEEGRRMLAVSRFQVLSEECDLFSTCWNELVELVRLDEPNTGSLIVLPPGYDVEQLQSFTDANLQQPLGWLGLDLSFEISSITRGNPALRMLHKLSAIPTNVG